MKMIRNILFTILVSSLLLFQPNTLVGQEDVYLDGLFQGELILSSPSLLLGQLSLESGHVAWAKGVRGAVINPASLTEIQNGEVATAYLQNKNWRNYQRINFNGGGDIGTVNLPVSVDIEQTGGLGYFLMGFHPPKPGMISLGGGDLARELFDLHLLGSGNADVEFSYLIPYTLTSQEIPNLPPGVEIPVQFQVEGRIPTTLNGEMRANLVNNPAYFAIALDGGPLGLGVGVKRTRIDGDLSADITLRGSGSLQASTYTTSSGWTADLTGVANFSEQDLSQVDGSINVHGEAITLILGTLLKADRLRVGITMEGTPSIPLGSDYGLLVLKPNDPPSIVNIRDNGIIIDTLNQRVQGDVSLDLSPILLTSSGDDGTEDFYTLPKEFNFRAGFAMNLAPVLLLVMDAGRSYSETQLPLTSFAFGLQFAPEAPLSFHTGFNIASRTYQIGDKTWNIPRGSATVGSALRVTDHFEANLSASTSTLIFAGSSLEEISRQVSTHKIMDSYVVGFGVKVGF